MTRTVSDTCAATSGPMSSNGRRIRCTRIWPAALLARLAAREAIDTVTNAARSPMLRAIRNHRLGQSQPESVSGMCKRTGSAAAAGTVIQSKSNPRAAM